MITAIVGNAGENSLRGYGGDDSVSGAATTSAHRIIYETDTGILRYDPDGTGAAAAIAFAIMDGLPSMNNADFIIA